MLGMLTLIISISMVARFLSMIYHVHKRSSNNISNNGCPIKTAVIIGSGGHTTEMLRLVKILNPTYYSPRIYIMASSDTSSEIKIHTAENYLSKTQNNCNYTLLKIPRSRSVSQKYVTSILTTCYAILASIPLMVKERPELVICNGPGTCIPICVIAFAMKFLWITSTKIVFIESVCRVNTLSLSGKLLLYFADEIIVQWPQLQQMYKRVKYLGRLV